MGTVTHQTIGYLFPMGPYYWILDQLGVPDWVAQRLWLGSLLFFAARRRALSAAHVRAARSRASSSPRSRTCARRTCSTTRRASRCCCMPWAALPWMIAHHRARRCATTAGWRYPAIFALDRAGHRRRERDRVDLRRRRAGAVDRVRVARRARGRLRGARSASAWRIGLLTLLTSLWWIAGLRMQGTYGLDILKYTETVEAVAPHVDAERGPARARLLVLLRPGPARPVDRSRARLHAAHLGDPRGLRARRAWRCSSAAFLRWRHRVFFVALLLVGVVIAVGAQPVRRTRRRSARCSRRSRTARPRASRCAAPDGPRRCVVLALALFLGLATNVVYRWLQGRRHAVLAIAVPAIVLVLVLVNFPALVDGTFYGKNLQRPRRSPRTGHRRSPRSNAGEPPDPHPRRTGLRLRVVHVGQHGRPDHARPHRPAVRRTRADPVRHGRQRRSAQRDRPPSPGGDRRSRRSRRVVAPHGHRRRRRAQRHPVRALRPRAAAGAGAGARRGTRPRHARPRTGRRRSSRNRRATSTSVTLAEPLTPGAVAPVVDLPDHRSDERSCTASRRSTRS